MKLKFRFFALTYIIFIFFSCRPAVQGNEKATETVLQKSDKYFSSLNWTESETIVKGPLSEPFTVKEPKTESIYQYSDANLNESIFPSLEGIGILDYSGIDANLITFLNSITSQIKEKKIKEDVCIKEKIFLPFMINYKLNLLKDISSIFYSRPEYNAEGIMISKLRCNISNEKKFYTMLEIGAVFSDGKWQLDLFDIIGDVDAGTFEQD